MCGCLLCAPYWGPGPATQTCALTGNRTSNLLVCRPALNPLSHASQGLVHLFGIFSLLLLSICQALPRKVTDTCSFGSVQKLMPSATHPALSVALKPFINCSAFTITFHQFLPSFSAYLSSQTLLYSQLRIHQINCDNSGTAGTIVSETSKVLNKSLLP